IPYALTLSTRNPSVHQAAIIDRAAVSGKVSCSENTSHGTYKTHGLCWLISLEAAKRISRQIKHVQLERTIFHLYRSRISKYAEFPMFFSIFARNAFRPRHASPIFLDKT